MTMDAKPNKLPFAEVQLAIARAALGTIKVSSRLSPQPSFTARRRAIVEESGWTIADYDDEIIEQARSLERVNRRQFFANIRALERHDHEEDCT